MGRGGWGRALLDVSPDLMVGWPAHCRAPLAAVWGGIKLYLGSTITIKILPAVSAAIRGWGGVDGGGHFWMYLGSITRIDAGLASLPLDAFGDSFRWGKNVFIVYYNNNNNPCSF